MLEIGQSRLFPAWITLLCLFYDFRFVLIAPRNSNVVGLFAMAQVIFRPHTPFVPHSISFASSSLVWLGEAGNQKIFDGVAWFINFRN